LNRIRTFALLPFIVLLSGCNAVVLHPSGDVAMQQRDLVVISTILMLLIIVPVMALTVFFAWRYRHTNTSATYEPDWDHSTHLELIIWSAPLLIIICLGALTWMATHLLDPFRPIGRTAPGQVVEHGTKTLKVNVVALDWKWLFIYPEQGIATVNLVQFPEQTPIVFSITSDAPMNSFWIPQLGGQIYAMPAMRSKMHLIANEQGTFRGVSANFSGKGFAGMGFTAKACSEEEFNQWVQWVRGSRKKLTLDAYNILMKPTEYHPIEYYQLVETNLFDQILMKYMMPMKE